MQAPVSLTGKPEGKESIFGEMLEKPGKKLLVVFSEEPGGRIFCENPPRGQTPGGKQTAGGPGEKPMGGRRGRGAAIPGLFYKICLNPMA